MQWKQEDSEVGLKQHRGSLTEILLWDARVGKGNCNKQLFQEVKISIRFLHFKDTQAILIPIYIIIIIQHFMLFCDYVVFKYLLF